MGSPSSRLHCLIKRYPNFYRKPQFLLGLAKDEKPIINTAFCNQMVFLFSQTKQFSVGENDTFSDPISVVATTRSPLDSFPTIDAGSSIRKPISLWPGMYHSPVTNALWEARSSIFERLSDAPLDPSPQTDLITKTPSKSRTIVLYKFSSDYVLREQYRNPWNEIRMGKLLEDLDALAGTISFKVVLFLYQIYLRLEHFLNWSLSLSLFLSHKHMLREYSLSCHYLYS